MYATVRERQSASLSLTVLSFFPKGASVNAAKLHETALHHAAKTKNVDLIELLVEFGGNVNARDNLNKKPIHYTSQGSPSYLCLEFYESKFVYSKCASCRCQCIYRSSESYRWIVTSVVFSSLDTPLSLQQISRVAVRGTLGTRAREVVSKLDLPSRIISFLSYSPPPVIEI